MTTSSTPYSQVRARPWLSADAARWAGVRPAWWARPVGPAVALVVALAVVTSSAPDPVCTASAPCGARWLDTAGTMLFLPHLLWVFLLPELTVVSAPVLLLWMAQPSGWEGGAGEKAADAVLVAGVVWSGAAAVARLWVRRRQRLLALDAAGGMTAVAPRPAHFHPWRRGFVRYAGGVLVCCGGAALLIGVVRADRADDRTAARAAHRTGVVDAYDPDAYVATVRLPDGSQRPVDTVAKLRVGARVPLLVDGDWVRLAAEPHGNRTGAQLLGLAVAGLGVTLVASGVLTRRRTYALRRGPVPVLRVQAQRVHARTEIFAADDPQGRLPTLHYLPRGSSESFMTLRQAYLYGAPREGGEAVLATVSGAGESGAWTAEASISVVRGGASWAMPRTPFGARTVPAQPSDGDAAPHPRMLAHLAAAEARVRAESAAEPVTAGPVHWRAGPLARLMAALLAIGGLALFLVLFGGTERWFYRGALCLACWYLLEACRRLGIWRLTADAEGLRLTSLWWTREARWADVDGVDYTLAGELVIACRHGAPEIRLAGLGVPRLERHLRRPSRPATAAAQATVMLRTPARRPRPTIGA
ncbi:hypothetical protein V2S66_23445 [Streptomyces sp. V4-01]|uniref:PH domain-containing protein n=1 Tax=Actinacidiphila polyblastidii TaxID=3110430 RepID=A0ABU7PGF8_9ACTN|nr:hypothetical protein [Streptomyces sp. V4-01]